MTRAAKHAAGAAAKHAAAETHDAPPKKSKKRLLIMIAVVIPLLIASGVAAFLLLTPAQPARHGAAAEAAQVKFVELGSYTANLMHEDGDRYLQISISLKLSKPDLDERIKASNPEIQHHLNMLLQSKRPSEISTFEGKQKLAEQIKGEVEAVLGLRKPQPSPTDAPNAPHFNSGISEVLFTSFIIQ